MSTCTPAADSALSVDQLDRVAAHMVASGATVHGPLCAALIVGGRSNLTYLVSDHASRWVLRTPPRVGRTPSAHDVAREFRVTSALAATRVPVPRPVVMVTDETVLGVPFLVVEHVDGENIRTQEALDELTDRDVEDVVDAMLRALVVLHSVRHLEVGLETFGRPEGYPARQLRRWSGQWDVVGATALRPLAAGLVERLQQLVPGQRSTSIVHGDFRLDNTIVRHRVAEGWELAAVIDWELSTIGDPVADVAMTCAYRDPVFDLISGSASSWTSPRLPAARDMAQKYESLGGLPLANWSWHLALAYFKIGVIAAGIDHRFRAGAADGEGYDSAGRAVEGYFHRAIQALADRET